MTPRYTAAEKRRPGAFEILKSRMSSQSVTEHPGRQGISLNLLYKICSSCSMKLSLVLSYGFAKAPHSRPSVVLPIAALKHPTNIMFLMRVAIRCNPPARGNHCLAGSTPFFPFNAFSSGSLIHPTAKNGNNGFLNGFRMMWSASLFEEYNDSEHCLIRSFAMITDAPPPQSARSGARPLPGILLDCLIIHWLTPAGRPLMELDQMLDCILHTCAIVV